MLKIKKVQIKNFRSIIRATLNFDQINIFVGLNDAGKSNILKALNLFFNDETEPGVEFDFETDYCKSAPIIAKKAKEIEIKITFSIPENYNDNAEVIWKKTWRKEGKNKNEYNRSFKQRSKVPILFTRIKYKYVPAVKSNDYFKYLLVDLYKSISSEVGNELTEKTKTYADALGFHTKRIAEIVHESIGIDSNLTMPNNQSEIFKALMFMTKDENDKEIDLSRRGDGIKSMHIPAILKYISEHDLKVLEKGAVPVTTIWGYEEPENGIELLKAFDLANELYNFSNDVQMLLTTHSPAFYNLNSKSNAKLFYVTKKCDNGQSEFVENLSEKDIHKKIGIMPLISEYIEEQEKKYSELEQLLQETVIDCNTIVVEGKTDKKYIEKAISIYSSSLQSKLEENSLRILTFEKNGGTTRMLDVAKSWMYINYRKKCVLLTDRDSAGEKLKINIENEKRKLKNKANADARIKVVYLNPTNTIKDILSKTPTGKFYYEIEELLPLYYRKKMFDKHQLISRENCDLISMCKDESLVDESAKSIIENLNLTEDVLEYYVKLQIDNKFKDDVCTDVLLSYDAGNSDIFEGFKDTIYTLEKEFGK